MALTDTGERDANRPHRTYGLEADTHSGQLPKSRSRGRPGSVWLFLTRISNIFTKGENSLFPIHLTNIGNLSQEQDSTKLTRDFHVIFTQTDSTHTEKL